MGLEEAGVVLSESGHVQVDRIGKPGVVAGLQPALPGLGQGGQGLVIGLADGGCGGGGLSGR